MNGISKFSESVYAASPKAKSPSGRDDNAAFSLSACVYEILPFVDPGLTTPKYINCKSGFTHA